MACRCGASSRTEQLTLTSTLTLTLTLTLLLTLQVRGLVQNRSKARQVLGCVRCDAEEGIFVGDVTDPETLVEPNRGARPPQP